MYLVDTNIFLELLLNRRQAGSVRDFFTKTDPESLCISDFSLHSIGILLFRESQYDLFIRFIADILDEGNIRILSLNYDNIMGLPDYAKKFRIDFDDAYQYSVARIYQMPLVSFDHDFDQTDIKRLTPAEILSSL